MRETNGAAKKVLLIDNSEADYLLACESLQTGGARRYSIERARSYEEAFQAIKRADYAVCLLDYHLNGNDGLDLLRKIIGSGSTGPVIVLAGEGDDAVDPKAMELGAADFLVKDQINAVLLERAIRHAIERENFQKALRRSEQRFRGLFDHSPDAIFVVNSESVVVNANPAAQRLYDAARSDLVGRNFLDLIPPNQRMALGRDLQAVTSSQPLAGNINLNRRGQAIMTEITATRISFDRRPAILMHVRDVSEHKRAEDRLRASREQLRSLSRRLQSAREKERKRIARAVHDELGGELTGLKLDVDWLAKRLSQVPEAAANPAFAQKLAAMSEMLDSTVEFVQKITSQLRPSVLDILGLIAAIQWQAGEFEQRTGVPCEIHTPPVDMPLDPARSTALFRIFQEILTNIARHARATKITVRITQPANSFVLEVHDDGRGISEAEIADPKSLGLLGMRERALVFGGQVSFKGAPDEGTTITVWVPLKS